MSALTAMLYSEYGGKNIMDELIKRLEWVRDSMEPNTPFGIGYAAGVDAAILHIKDFFSREEYVVHCRDCKSFAVRPDGKCGICTVKNDVLPRIVPPNHFCSFGERRKQK